MYPDGQLFCQSCFLSPITCQPGIAFLNDARNAFGFSPVLNSCFCITCLLFSYFPSLFCWRTSSNTIVGCKWLASLSSGFQVAVEKSKDYLIPNSLFICTTHPQFLIGQGIFFYLYHLKKFCNHMLNVGILKSVELDRTQWILIVNKYMTFLF